MVPSTLLPEDTRHFYFYAGSLATPPCAEGVRWYPFSEPIQIALSQIEPFMAKYYSGNALVKQKLNGRNILSHLCGNASPEVFYRPTGAIDRKQAGRPRCKYIAVIQIKFLLYQFMLILA